MELRRRSGAKPQKPKTYFENKILKHCSCIRHHSSIGILVPGAAVTKSPPPVVFCQVGVSHRLFMWLSHSRQSYSCQLKSVIFVDGTIAVRIIATMHGRSRFRLWGDRRTPPPPSYGHVPVTSINVDRFSKFFHFRTQHRLYIPLKIPPHFKRIATLPCEM